MELIIEALVREAYEMIKMKIDVKGRSIIESGLSGLEDAEEDASLHTDGAYVEAEGAYNGDIGEGAERATPCLAGKRRP